MRSSAQFALLITVPLLFPLLSGADPLWFWQHPSPTGVPITAIHFTDSNHGWMGTGWTGEIYRTVDGGQTWELVACDLAWGMDIIEGLFFADSLQGWVCGQSDSVFHTADGGLTWTAQEAGASGFNAIHFTDTDYGALVGSNDVQRTSNGGQTWYTQETGYNGTLNDVQFVDVNHGWAATASGSVLRTETAGAFWEELPTQFGSSLYTLRFIDQLTGWTAGYSGIQKTADGGDSWTVQYDGPYAVLDLAMTSSGEGYAACEDTYDTWARVLYTSNGGDTWQLEEFGIGPVAGEYTNVNAVSIPDPAQPTEAWAGAGMGRLLKRSGPDSWELHTDLVTVSDISSVCCVDDYLVWACGSESAIIHSINGGLDWELQDAPGGFYLKDIVFPDASSGYACGLDEAEEYGVILGSEDGGQTWEDITPDLTPTLKGLWSVDFSDADRGVAVGEEGEIVYTLDGGQSWTREGPLVSSMFRDVNFAGADVGYAAGYDGTMVKFDISSDSWTEQYSATDADLWTVFALDESTAWAGGWNGTLIRTQDGIEWEEVGVTGWDYRDIHFFNSMEGYLATSGYGMFWTEDGGSTLTEMDQGLDFLVRDFCFAGETSGWGCGEENGVFRFAETQTSVHRQQSPAPGPAVPGLSAFPNPFREAAAIRVSMPQSGEASLRLYDLSGRLMRVLHSGYLEAGNHSFGLDAGRLPAGVYFVRLTGDGGVRTHRCVKL